MIFTGIMLSWRAIEIARRKWIKIRLIRFARANGISWAMARDVGSNVFHTHTNDKTVMEKYIEAINKADITRLKRAMDRVM